MSMIFLAVFILAGLLFLSTAVLLAIWTYKDATALGLNAPLWTVIVVLFGSHLLGLLIYVLFARREAQANCPECAQKTPKKSEHCIHCGADVRGRLSVPKNPAGKWLIAVFATLLAGILLIGGGFAAAIVTDRLPMNGVSMWKVENEASDYWNVSFMRSSETLEKTFWIKDSDVHTIVIDATCDEGNMSFLVIAGDQTYSSPANSGESRIQIDSSELQTVRVVFTMDRAKNGSFSVTLE